VIMIEIFPVSSSSSVEAAVRLAFVDLLVRREAAALAGLFD
jgi:hypothetical protein